MFQEYFDMNNGLSVFHQVLLCISYLFIHGYIIIILQADGFLIILFGFSIMTHLHVDIAGKKVGVNKVSLSFDGLLKGIQCQDEFIGHSILYALLHEFGGFFSGSSGGYHLGRNQPGAA